MDVGIALFDGFDDLDAIGPFEVFGHARSLGADLEVTLCSVDDANVVTSSHGLRIAADDPLPVDRDHPEDATPRAPDLLVVPGGGWGNRASAGAWAEARRGDLPDDLAALHAGGTTMAGVCTGVMLLATANLTDGRPAVTHHGALDDLRAAGAEVVDARVVDDGDLLTAGGVTSGIDLGLHLVERTFGRDLASAVATEMEYDRRGEVYTRGRAG